MPKDEIKEKLQALLIAYTKNLPDKIHNIENLWRELCEQWDQEKIQILHREVHSLSGSAGTYGYVELGKSARQLEIFLKSLLSENEISFKQKTEITKLLNEFNTVLQQIIPGSVSTLPSASKEVGNILYLLGNDDNLIQEMQKYIKQNNYTIQSFSDLTLLIDATRVQHPSALLIDIQYISNEAILDFKDFFKKEMLSIPIFCMADKNDILSRLKAIRLGGQVFLQKPVDAFYFVKALDQQCGTSSIEPYRILIVDDSQSLAEYYALTLHDAGMNTEYITNPLCLLELIDKFQPDLILMDVYMPECTGLELAAILRQEARYTKIPIIFLSTEDDRFKQLSALSMGGDDFLTKPILPQHLIEAVKFRAKRAGALNYFMVRDSLTGLLNHTNILQRLDIELARAQRLSSPLSFAMIDIDHFKKINDTYGHPVGDMILKSLSVLLTNLLRKIDVAGRYGGEEFAIILPDTDKNGSLTVCNFLKEEFSKISYKGNGTYFHSTFSVGIATFPSIQNAKDLITCADEALYSAKHSGRNRIVCFES